MGKECKSAITKEETQITSNREKTSSLTGKERNGN